MKPLLLFSFLLICHLSDAQPAVVSQRIAAVENGLIPYVPVRGFATWNLVERMRYHQVPGASVAVIRNYQIDWAKSYGLADTTRRIPATNTTLYSAGSVSKLLTAALALKLVQQGKMHLDSPINQYLSSWKLAENDYTRKTPVTLRMLLSHTGGTSQSAYFGFTPDKHPLPSIVEILSGAPVAESRGVIVNSEPGKEFRYSGGGSMIVQMALMDITQKDFATLAQEEIFGPLGMQHSTFQQPLPDPFARQVAWGYSAAPWYKGIPYVYPQQAAAGLHTTATDLALFFIELQKCQAGKGSLLSAASLRQMLTPVVTTSEGTYREQVGLGTFLMERSGNTDPKGKYFEHQGVNAGFVAYAMGSVEGGDGVVILLNTGDDTQGFGMELRRAVARVYGWTSFLPDEIKPAPATRQRLDSYTGRFRRGPDEVVYISREKNYLVERINEGKQIYCFPAGGDSIVFTDFNARGWFGRDAAGKVVSLQTAYQDKPMQKMQDDEFTPSEYLKAKKYAAAKEGFRDLNMNEYQVTYLAYELMNKRPLDQDAVHMMLQLAVEQHPKSAIVYNRWGDYYKMKGDKANALASYKKALQLDPSDEMTKAAINALEQ